MCLSIRRLHVFLLRYSFLQIKDQKKEEPGITGGALWKAHKETRRGRWGLASWPGFFLERHPPSLSLICLVPPVTCLKNSSAAARNDTNKDFQKGAKALGSQKERQHPGEARVPGALELGACLSRTPTRYPHCPHPLSPTPAGPPPLSYSKVGSDIKIS